MRSWLSKTLCKVGTSVGSNPTLYLFLNKTMKNISKEDYILWNIEDNIPLEEGIVIYHYTSVIELINDNI